MKPSFHDCKTIMWYDQYCENTYPNGFKAYTPDAVLHDLDTIGADIVALYAANQWGLAYYPSEVVPQSIGLDGRDYFGEVLAGLKARGKKVIGYINWLDSRHPEWRYRRLTPAGVEAHQEVLEPVPYYDNQHFGTVYARKYGEWFCHCIGSPRCDEVFRLTRELVTRYPAMDGFHMDMYFNYGICGCDYCQPVLRKITGKQLVTYADVLAHWDEYLSWRQEVSTNTIKAMAGIVRAAGMAFAPNAWCPIYLSQTMAAGTQWWEYQDFYITEAWLRLASGFADVHSTTIVSKWLQAIKMPSALLVTGQHPEFSHAPLCIEEYRLHAASCLANGAPVLGSCGQGAYPSTASSPAALQTMGTIFKEYTSRAAELAPQRKSLARIAVLWSQDTRDFFEPGDDSRLYKYEFLGYCRALLEEHYLFDLIVPEKLQSVADLQPYAYLLLPNTACMDEATAAIIRDFVANGGRLLATWETGWRESTGSRRADTLLADVLGLHMLHAYKSSTVYTERLPESCVVYGGTSVVEPTCAVTLLRFAEPDPDYPDVGTGVDLVPGPVTDHPFMTVNKYETGQAWYIAGSLGYAVYKSGYYQMSELLREVFCSIGLPRDITIEAPATVEFNAERDEHGMLYLHLGNQTVPSAHPGKQLDRSIDAFITLRGIRLHLPFPVDVRYVECASGDVVVEQAENGTILVLPPLRDYMLIKILANDQAFEYPVRVS